MTTPLRAHSTSVPAHSRYGKLKQHGKTRMRLYYPPSARHSAHEKETQEASGGLWFLGHWFFVKKVNKQYFLQKGNVQQTFGRTW